MKEPAFAALPDDIQGAIEAQFVASAAVGVLPLVGSLLETLFLAFFGFSDESKAEDFINSPALYNLSPIEALARQKLSGDLISAPGIKLRMAMISLETGALKYTTESGAVLLDSELPYPAAARPDLRRDAGLRGDPRRLQDEEDWK